MKNDIHNTYTYTHIYMHTYKTKKMKNKILFAFVACLFTIGIQAEADIRFGDFQDEVPFGAERQQRLPSEESFRGSRTNGVGTYSDTWNPGGVGTPDPEDPGDQSTGGITPVGSGILPVLLFSGFYILYQVVGRRNKSKSIAMRR